MGHVHLSRRDILKSIPVLGRGSILVPAGLMAQRRDTSVPGVIRGSLVDEATGKPTAAKIRVVETNTGQAYLPPSAIKTMPKRTYFYARGSYEIAVPPGRYQIEVVRGISHKAAVDFTEVGSGITHVVDFRIPVLKDMHSTGWYSGNTHTHYALEIDEDPDDRLRMVPPAEGLDVSVISYLIRNDSPYITNRYPVGRLPQFSNDGTIMDMGEEARNNRTFGGFGYGHVLFLNIPKAIEPVSTGLLSKTKNSPDFPTLSMLCAEAQRMGGTTVWCHNGSGIESPVAAALGHMNAYNLADGLEANYDRYYRLLNCGLRMPASSGTDWWIYDHNRVFVQVGGSFTYESWIAGLRAGRTFVSNGPLLELRVNGQGPGASVRTAGTLQVSANVVSRLPFERVQIVYNGEVVGAQTAWNNGEAKLEREFQVDRGGWIAARVSGGGKTHAGFTVFAHTSPIYVRVAGTPHRRAEAAGAFVDEIEDSIRSIRKHYAFANDADRALAVGALRGGPLGVRQNSVRALTIKVRYAAAGLAESNHFSVFVRPAVSAGLSCLYEAGHSAVTKPSPSKMSPYITFFKLSGHDSPISSCLGKKSGANTLGKLTPETTGRAKTARAPCHWPKLHPSRVVRQPRVRPDDGHHLLEGFG